MKKFELEVDYELADKITIGVLSEYRDSLKRGLDEHFENGSWLHPDDVVHGIKMIKSINFVLKDFGVGDGEDYNTNQEAP